MVDVTLQCDVSDPDGDSMDVTFYDASDDSTIATDSGVADGGTASVTWSGLTAGNTYNWYAVADDGSATTQSSTWSFYIGQDYSEVHSATFNTTTQNTRDVAAARGFADGFNAGAAAARALQLTRQRNATFNTAGAVNRALQLGRFFAAALHAGGMADRTLVAPREFADTFNAGAAAERQIDTYREANAQLTASGDMGRVLALGRNLAAEVNANGSTYNTLYRVLNALINETTTADKETARHRGGSAHFTESGSVARRVGKVFAAALNADGSTSKALHRVLAALINETTTADKQATTNRDGSAQVAANSSVAREIAKVFAAAFTTAAQFERGISVARAFTNHFDVGSMLISYGMAYEDYYSAAVGFNTAFDRALSAARSGSAAFAATMQGEREANLTRQLSAAFGGHAEQSKAVAEHGVAGFAATAESMRHIPKQLMAAFNTNTTEHKTLARLLSAAFSADADESKAFTEYHTAGFATATDSTRHIARQLVATFGADATESKDISKRFTALYDMLGEQRQRAIFKACTASYAALSTAANALGKQVAADLAANAEVSKQTAKQFAALFNTAAEYKRTLDLLRRCVAAVEAEGTQEQARQIIRDLVAEIDAEAGGVLENMRELAYELDLEIEEA